MGFVLIFLSILLSISFLTYSPSDPSFIYGENNVSVSNYFGIYGSMISDFLLQSFGVISFLLLITILSWGIRLVLKKELNKIIFKLLFLIIYIISGCAYINITYDNSFWLIDNGNSGFIGKNIVILMQNYIPLFESYYTEFVLIFITILFFFLASELNLLSILRIFLNKKNNDNNQTLDPEKSNYQKIEDPLNDSIDNKKSQQSFLFDNDKKTEIKNNQIFKLPSIELLEKNKIKVKLDEINKNRPSTDFMEKILLDFGIEGNIKKINNGPVVSLYEFEPAPGIKVSKIVNLSDDLARNTSSTSARVAVIPGKNTVGIEIPNESRESVLLREIIANEKFANRDIRLPIALGKSISGFPIIGDLTSMPHLLIAGTTGSGKSVCINTIIVSLLYKLNPNLCKLILIDPKMLELSAYEGILIFSPLL